jgi:hypothetical protein
MYSVVIRLQDRQGIAAVVGPYHAPHVIQYPMRLVEVSTAVPAGFVGIHVVRGVEAGTDPAPDSVRVHRTSAGG